MKFFVDTADTAEIKALAASGLLDGVTTNPTLMSKTGKKFQDVLAEICAVVPGPVSAEVVEVEDLPLGQMKDHFDAIEASAYGSGVATRQFAMQQGTPGRSSATLAATRIIRCTTDRRQGSGMGTPWWSIQLASMSDSG
jgi:hypothetical protein